MASARQPTARQARLGAELRKLREAAGMSGTEAAAFLGGERSLISHVEAGRWGIKPERVQFLASHYAATDQDLIHALTAMARERRNGWWEKYRGVLPPAMLDLSELEHHAARLRTAQALLIPGIFQIDEYARAVFSSSSPGISDDELNVRVAHRVSRRGIFERESPTPYEAIIHEAALHINYGSRGIARKQLEYLLSITEWPSVEIRVIPFDLEAFIGLTPQLFYSDGPLSQLDTVVVESAHDIIFLDARAQLDKYRALFAAFEKVSLDVDGSRKIIHRILGEK
ncbi:helix-turn-helix transcriptional regulator [Streptomyces sp. NPDC097640]|uniref:helix-turn-helix domain-containing protein n=1 Tax=Streptomyces sp. NPDC097640 TaxID=3157229 RepID=UPI00331C5AEF